ncbi:hypothetical protein D3C72_1948590 [compost metagenome]
MIDSYITARGSTSGTNYTKLATITSSSYQLNTIDNLNQFTSLACYLLYPGNKVIVSEITIPMDLFKTTMSSNCLQVYYNDGSVHYGRIYFNSENSFYGLINNADSLIVYGIN